LALAHRARGRSARVRARAEAGAAVGGGARGTRLAAVRLQSVAIAPVRVAGLNEAQAVHAARGAVRNEAWDVAASAVVGVGLRASLAAVRRLPVAIGIVCIAGTEEARLIEAAPVGMVERAHEPASAAVIGVVEAGLAAVVGIAVAVG